MYKGETMNPGQLSTNTTALKQRLLAHEKYGSNDLNAWIFDHLQLTKGLSMLDIGCGTGKQTLDIAQTIGETGSVLAIDLSQESLNTLAQAAKASGVAERIRLLQADIDDLGNHLAAQCFDQ